MRVSHRVIHVPTGNIAWLLPPSRGTPTLALLNKKIKPLTHYEREKVSSTPSHYLYSFSLLFKEPNQQSSYYLAHKQQWMTNVYMYV